MQVTKIPKKTVTVIEPKRSLIVDKEKYHQQRVAAYCRVSTDSEEQLTSYTTKESLLEMIAARKDGRFAGLYLTRASQALGQTSALILKDEQ